MVVQWSWHPHKPSPGNLLGTYSSLDQIGTESAPPYDVVPLDCAKIAQQNLTVTGESLHCAYGVVSRDGWALVNDTGSPTFDPATGWWSGENSTR